ncbi:MAG: 4Fe-4S dicluster domain-containing protein [Actinobacteria bacterium]|nr:4Fe-4S dicluster domain-containing protein [Actinomycetota bacterium]
MALRKIIEIDEDICNGCGQCIPNCPEGALQLIDGKARLVSDLFCDGLGACIGECPVDAITVIEREAEPYNETKVMENIVKQGSNVIAAHLKHLKDHNETGLYNEAVNYLKNNNIYIPEDFKQDAQDEGDRLPCGCPGSAVMDLREKNKSSSNAQTKSAQKSGFENNAGSSDILNLSKTKAQKVQELLNELSGNESQLRQWPVQIMLVPPHAPYLQGADLLVSADCVPFAYAGFHQDFLAGKVVLIGCPKLDDSQYYLKKFTEIFKLNDIKSVTVTHMEVPCCFGLAGIIKQAIKDAEKDIALKTVNIGIKGNVVSES